MAYKAAVIGLGMMGSIADGFGGKDTAGFSPFSHADVYECHPKIELIAGATRDCDRQRLFRERHSRSAVYVNYLEMLESEAIDLLSVATPATSHAEIVIAAANSGVRAIYCEKAMAASLRECDDMIQACEKSGTVLAINHQRRWDDRFRAMKRLIQDGGIGEIQAIQIHFGGGRLCRSGSHMFDLSLMFAPGDVTKGYGWLADSEAYDPGGVGLFETTHGVRIVVDGCDGMGHPVQFEAIGTRGLIRVIDGGFRFEWRTFEEISGQGQMVERNLPMNYPVRNPMLNAVDDIIHCIENGHQPLSSGYDGRAAFEMIAAIHQSHINGGESTRIPMERLGLRIESK